MKISIITLLFLAVTACGSSDKQSLGDPITALSSVETKAPNADYAPAFEGQTRINGVQTVTKYEATVINSNLSLPWGITSLPDGRLLITEKAGTMRIVTTTGIMGSAITGIPAVNASGQGGLLGLCIDPQFSAN